MKKIFKISSLVVMSMGIGMSISAYAIEETGCNIFTKKKSPTCEDSKITFDIFDKKENKKLSLKNDINISNKEKKTTIPETKNLKDELKRLVDTLQKLKSENSQLKESIKQKTVIEKKNLSKLKNENLQLKKIIKKKSIVEKINLKKLKNENIFLKKKIKKLTLHQSPNPNETVFLVNTKKKKFGKKELLNLDMNDYIVVTFAEGESLKILSQRFYGNPNNYKYISKANKGKIGKNNHVTIGTKIIIPGLKGQ